MVRLRMYDVLSLLPPSHFEGSFNALLRELVAEFTLTDNPANTTTSRLRALCHHDDSVILGSWLQETDHKAIEDQVRFPSSQFWCWSAQIVWFLWFKYFSQPCCTCIKNRFAHDKTNILQLPLVSMCWVLCYSRLQMNIFSTFANSSYSGRSLEEISKKKSNLSIFL